MNVSDGFFTVTVERLSPRGDGVALWNGKKYYVPYACPGDEATLRASDKGNRAEIVALVSPSSLRKAPECPQFGACGGCGLQHLNTETYLHFKRSLLGDACARLGAEKGAVMPIVSMGYGARTRARFHVSVVKGAVSIGFYAAKSADVTAATECLVCVPSITRSLSLWKELCENLKNPGRLSSIGLASFDEGMDATMSLKKPLHPSDKEKLLAFSAQHLCRLSLCEKEGEAPTPIYVGEHSPTARCGSVRVRVPPGGFSQATEEGRLFLAGFAASRLANCERVVDLYSGYGNYAFALAERVGTVAAYEGDAAAVACAHDAARRFLSSGKMSVHCRDLYVDPLREDELRHVDGACVNPPRNGAEPQTRRLAGSGVGRVVMISCDLISFERDARILIEAGYRLLEAVPVDQFYQTPHVEIASLFYRQSTAVT
ncbi:MAG: hypothetical protein ABW189_06330 [Rickettsiales bacterium]